MPLSSAKRFTLAPGAVAVGTREQLQERSWSLPDLVVAAGAREFLPGSAVVAAFDKYRQDQIPEVSGFDPLENPEETIGEDFFSDLPAFANARSPDEVEFIKERIRRERKHRQTIADAGVYGVVANLAMGFIDPVDVVLPVHKFVNAGKGLRAAGEIAAAAAVGVAASESALSATQLTRSQEEMLYNIGGAVVLSGVLGTAAQGLGKAQREYLDAVTDRNIRVRDELVDRLPVSPEELRKLGPDAQDELIRKAYLEVSPEAKKLVMPNSWSGKVMGGVFRFTPGGRGALSESANMRTVTDALINTPFLKTGEASAPAVESFVERWHGRAASAIENARIEFADYRSRGGKIVRTEEDFLNQVGMAMRRSDGQVGNFSEEVRRSARYIREEIFEPLYQDALKLGLVPDDPGLKGTALSYFTRVYDTQKLKNPVQRARFKKVISTWLRQENKLKAGESADEVAEQITRNILEHERGKIPIDIVREAGPLKDRMLLIPDHKIEEFLISDPDVVVRRYARTMAPQVELAKRFGREGQNPKIQSLEMQIKRLEGALPEQNELAASLKQARETVKELRTSLKAGEISDDLVRAEEALADLRTAKSFDDYRVALNNELAELRYTEARRGVGLEDYLDDIRNEYQGKIDEALSAGKEKQAKRLTKAMESDLKDVRAMRDRIMGTYGVPEDPEAFGFRVTQALKRLNFLRFMGGVQVSSIPDVAMPVFVNGINRTFGKGIKTLAKAPLEFSRAAKRDLVKTGIVTELVGGLTRSHRYAEILDEFGKGTAFERGLATTANKFSRYALMDHWNGSMKMMAGMLASDRILEDSLALAAGKASAKQIENLGLAGINKRIAKRISKAWQESGAEMLEDTLHLSRSADWADKEARAVFEAATLQEINRTILTPGAGDIPLFMSRPMGGLFMQFKSFAFGATNRILLSGLQRRDMAVMNGYLSLIAMGTITSVIKNQLAGRETDFDNVPMLIANGVDQSGALGLFFDANNIIERFSMGTVGVSPLLGGPGMSRYRSRNWHDAVLGPSLGTVEDLGRIAQSSFGTLSGVERVNQSDVNRMRRMLPFQNLWYARGMFDALQNKAGEALGAEDPYGLRR